MNVKVRMPKLGKKPNVKRNWVKELLLSILATSISIVLTFGTAYLIEHHQKVASQRQMAMMIIHDIDESIRQMEKADSIIRKFSDLQVVILEGKYNRFLNFARVELIQCDPTEVKFAETTERIFTTNVDTWSTIGKVDFIDNVSSCYIDRRDYQTRIIDAFHKQIKPSEGLDLLPLDDLLYIEADYFVAESREIINRMKTANELNKQIMGISEKDLEEFTSNMVGLDKTILDSLNQKINDEFMQRLERKDAAMDNFQKNKDTMYPNKEYGSK